MNKYGYSIGGSLIQLNWNYNMSLAGAITSDYYQHRWYGIMLFNKYAIGFSVFRKIAHPMICVKNTDYETSLTLNKIYPTKKLGAVHAYNIEDAYINVIDDTNDEYIYPKSWFKELK